MPTYEQYPLIWCHMANYHHLITSLTASKISNCYSFSPLPFLPTTLDCSFKNCFPTIPDICKHQLPIYDRSRYTMKPLIGSHISKSTCNLRFRHGWPHQFSRRFERREATMALASLCGSLYYVFGPFNCLVRVFLF